MNAYNKIRQVLPNFGKLAGGSGLIIQNLQTYGNLLLVNDCTYARKDLAGVEKAVCFRLGPDIYTSTVLAIIIGTLAFLYSCCAFFSLRMLRYADQPATAYPTASERQLVTQTAVPQGQAEMAGLTKQPANFTTTTVYQ